MNELNLQLMQH
jgi:hypothetical protein